MEPVQIVLLIVIVILTLVLAILGVQVFLILVEIRKSVQKTNKIIDDIGTISESIATPVSTASSMIMNLKNGLVFVGWIKKFYEILAEHTPFKKDKNNDEIIDEEEIKTNEKPEEDMDKSEKTEGDNLNHQSNGDSVNGEAEKKEEKKTFIRRFFRGTSRKRV